MNPTPPGTGSHGVKACNALSAGISLVELIVVMAIVIVLALAVMPGYRSQLLRSQRAEATAALLAMAAAQEKYYLQHNSYASALTDPPPAGLGLAATTAHGHYRTRIDAADVEGWAATATAIGAQADDAHCAEFRLNQAGLRRATSDDCWGG